MSMIENLSFDDRAEIMGKSFDSHVLIINFSDAHIMTLNYVLETPIEISCIEFHPENPNDSQLFGTYLALSLGSQVVRNKRLSRCQMRKKTKHNKLS
jgi:hypothetical protein